MQPLSSFPLITNYTKQLRIGTKIDIPLTPAKGGNASNANKATKKTNYKTTPDNDIIPFTRYY